MKSVRDSDFVPLPYRRVSQRDLDCDLTPENIRGALLGQDAYRRTEFIVVQYGEAYCVVEVETEDREPLFSPIRSIEVLAEPPECHFVRDPDLDVGRPSSLAARALELDVSPSETLIVEGKYSHLNFIHRPDPVKIHLFDVIPPEPSKLDDLVRRVLDYADLPAIVVESTIVDMVKRAREHPDSGYLFPCRASDVELPEASVAFLDDHPPADDWTLVGCDRTQEIYDHFYDRPANRVEMCPRKLDDEMPEPRLIRCCQLEEGFNREGLVAEVPWGAEVDEVEAALRDLHRAATTEGGSSHE